jgi:hypothetical protein
MLAIYPPPAFAGLSSLFRGFFLVELEAQLGNPGRDVESVLAFEIGCSAIDFLNPPTRTLAPAPTPSAPLAVARPK